MELLKRLIIIMTVGSCGQAPSCESELLTLHHTRVMVIDEGTLDHITRELERATGRRWKVQVDLIDYEVSDVYEAQKLWGEERGYHLSIYSPPFHDGYYWGGGMAFALGCTKAPYRVAVCTYSGRNVLGSRTGCLHELGHLAGATSGGGPMSSTNRGDQFYTKETVAQIRPCFGRNQCTE